MRGISVRSVCIAALALVVACTQPLPQETTKDLSDLTTGAASLVGQPAALQEALAEETRDNRNLCRYLSGQRYDLGESFDAPQASELAQQQAAVGEDLVEYTEALVGAMQGESLSRLRTAYADFGSSFGEFAGEAGASPRVGPMMEAGLALAGRIGEAGRQKQIREIMLDATAPIRTLQVLLERDVGQVTAETERAVAAWDRAARCVLRASRRSGAGPDLYRAFDDRRRLIAGELAAVKGAPGAVDKLRRAHILAATEELSAAETLSVFVDTLGELDALIDAARG